MWVAFAVFVVAMLLVDGIAFGRRRERIPFRRSVAWSIAWTLLGLAFGAFVWVWQGRELAGEYLAGFLIEKSLSIDNLFVFALVFGYFGVPPAFQRRALFWGIAGAIVLRAIFILAGAHCSRPFTTRSTSSAPSSSSPASGSPATATSRSTRSETLC
jgi:tellurite resistance protein TerC